MKYVISCSSGYIQVGAGGPICVKELHRATKFVNQNKASNALTHLSNKFWAKSPRILELDEESQTCHELTTGAEVEEDNTEVLELLELEVVDIAELKAAFARVQELMLEIADNKENMQQSISLCDKKIIDIQHQMELSTFNVCEGYKLAKEMQEVLQQRRVMKDLLMVTSTIENQQIKDITTGHTIATLEGLDNRKYTPRVR